MAREVHNNRMNGVGHGGTSHDGSHAPQGETSGISPMTGPNLPEPHANFADLGFANHQYWTIDFFHVATKKCVNFRAFITEFADNFTSNWDSEAVYGRMDELKVFKGTTRKISFAWAVPSVDENEARKNLHKFEHLSALLYPTYERRSTGISTLAGSPLLKIKFGNLIQDSTKNSRSPRASSGGLTGTVAGFSMTPNVDLGFFTPAPGIFLPKVYTVSCEFDVIHNHALGWDKNSSWLTHPKDKFPYGIHEQTGEHSICRDKSRAPSKNSPSKSQSTSKTLAANAKAAVNGILDVVGYSI